MLHQADIDDRAEAFNAELDTLMQEVRDLGRYPKRPPGGKGGGKRATDVCPEQERE